MSYPGKLCLACGALDGGVCECPQRRMAQVVHDLPPGVSVRLGGPTVEVRANFCGLSGRNRVGCAIENWEIVGEFALDPDREVEMIGESVKAAADAIALIRSRFGAEIL